MTVPLDIPRVAGRVRPENADLPYLLINPPLTDPTYPYHSISYLVANCAEHGFTGFRCEDANINSLNHLARPNYVSGLLTEARAVCEQVTALASPTRADELRYQCALSAIGLSDDFMQRAIDVLRTPEHFYDYPVYQDAAMAARRFINLLSLRALPGLFSGYTLRFNGPVNLLSQADLTDSEVLDRVVGGFSEYFDGPFADLLADRDWRLIGLSVNYSSQLPFALRMARQARAQCPNAVIVFGGTEVCDDVKYVRDPADLWRIFADADALVPGEGESPLVDILAAIRDDAPLRGITGVLLPGSDTSAIRLNYEHVGRLPTPRYDIWDWSSYWSPEPVVLYSPTRGCYWNKCTFCDYGLNNDRPTSPSRERPVDVVMGDLAHIASFARTLYFSVDAMSPRYLRTLAEAMATADLGLRWSAELRLERTFPKRGTAALLKRAGCVAIAFGYESATQRILNLIDKGVDIAQVPAILQQLAEAGIGVQMMGFTGFPSETPSEAKETYEFLVRHGELWSLAAIGEFALTPGSIVAKQPERYGVAVLPLPASHSIARGLGWRDLATGCEFAPGADADTVPPDLKAQIKRNVVGRPFVGGVDSSHTVLYFSRYGRSLLPAQSGSAQRRDRIASEQLVPVPFACLDELCSVADLAAANADSLSSHDRVSYAEMSRWLSEPGTGRRGTSTALVMPGGAVVDFGATAAGVDAELVVQALRCLLTPAAQAAR
jgi:hypothetical protein